MIFKKTLFSLSLIAFSIISFANIPVYKVGTDAIDPPINLKDELGKADGLEIDLLKAIAAKRGFEVTFMINDFSKTIENLRNGEIDIVAAGISAVPNFAEFTFTDPYIYKRYIAVIPKEVAIEKGINNYEDLHLARIAVQENTARFKKLVEDFGGENLIPMPSQYRSVAEVIRKNADAAFGDDLNIRNFTNRSPQMNWVEISDGIKIPVIFLVGSGNTALQQEINQGLKEIVEDGTYQALMEKWLDQKTLQENNIH